jgi:hypothetical protein
LIRRSYGQVGNNKKKDSNQQGEEAKH